MFLVSMFQKKVSLTSLPSNFIYFLGVIKYSYILKWWQSGAEGMTVLQSFSPKVVLEDDTSKLIEGPFVLFFWGFF